MAKKEARKEEKKDEPPPDDRLRLGFMEAAAACAIALILLFSNNNKQVFNSWGFMKWGGVELQQLPIEAGVINTAVAMAIFTAYTTIFLAIYYLLQKKPLNLRQDLLAATAYAVMALLMTYPLIFYYTTHVQGDDIDANVIIWRLWWVKNAITEFKNPFYTDYVCYPHGTSNFLNAIMPLLGFMAAPIYAIAGVVVAYNTLNLLAAIWSGLGMYKLVEYLTAKKDTAFVCGLAFAFIPYRMVRMVGHMNIISNQWMPFYVLHLIKGLREGNSRDFFLAALFAAATTWTELTQVMFIGMMTAVILPGHLVKNRAQLKESRIYWNIALFLTVYTALISPWIVMMISEYGSYERFDRWAEVITHSTDLLAYITPPSYNPLIGSPFAGIEAMYTSFIAEKIAYVGVAVLILAFVSFLNLEELLKGRYLNALDVKWDRIAWIAMAALFFMMSLGPLLHVRGVEGYMENGEMHFVLEDIIMPYRLIGSLPLVSVTRTPARFSIGVAFALIVLAGYGLEKAGNIRSKQGVLALASALIVIEFSAVPYPLADMGYSPGFAKLGKSPGEVVYDIPSNTKAEYYQTIHGKKTINCNPLRGRTDLATFSQKLSADLKNMTVDEFARKYGVDYYVIHRKRVDNETTTIGEYINTFGKPYFVDDDIAIFKTENSA